MNIHYGAILIATVVQFIIGAIWYMPLFGNLWGKIHGFDNKSPEVQKEMRKGMFPLLAVQFVITLVTSFVFDLLRGGFPPEWNIYGLAGFFWLGFIVPTQIAGVIFGGTNPKWVMKKILVMVGGSLACMMSLAFVMKMF